MSPVAKTNEQRYVRLLTLAGPRVPETEDEYKLLLSQPGKILREEFLIPLRITQTQLADQTKYSIF